jgi:hypothetical protein
METQTTKPKLKLTGEDGNAFFILGKARRVALANKMDWEAIKAEATSGDYNDLLATMMKYFDVD